MGAIAFSNISLVMSSISSTRPSSFSLVEVELLPAICNRKNLKRCYYTTFLSMYEVSEGRKCWKHLFLVLYFGSLEIISSPIFAYTLYFKLIGIFFKCFSTTRLNLVLLISYFLSVKNWFRKQDFKNLDWYDEDKEAEFKSLVILEILNEQIFYVVHDCNI